ncbi:hypothetical protein HK104_009651 [Borealophlyctis nickersoniae]|nr:hypothetical protein HK104_009651 [Borealophlyctis nickersoniae]
MTTTATTMLNDGTMTPSQAPKSLTSEINESPPAPIPNMDDLEREKENIAPLRQGRSASVLSAHYATGAASHPTTKDSAQLDAERAALEAELASVTEDTDDPLDPHHRYLRWLQERLPMGHKDIMRALETALRLFRKDARYKNDPRYLRMWLMLAESAQEPLDVFKYMSINEIGEEQGTFYQEYSSLMERNKRYLPEFRFHFSPGIKRARIFQRWLEADEIFRTGIARKAQPLDRLKRKYVQFQQRMAAAEAAKEAGEAEGLTAPPPEPELSRPRTALAPKGKSTTGLSTRVSASSASSASMPRGANKPIKVYRDKRKDTECLKNQVLPSASSANPWPEFGTSTSRRKENIREATRWTGSTLPQMRRSRSVSRIQVYRDEDVLQSEHSESGGSPSSATPAGASALKEKRVRSKSAPSTRRLLRKLETAPDPPKGPLPEPATGAPASGPPKRAADVPPPSVPNLPKPSLEIANQIKKPDVRKFDISLIYVGDDEFSFEEIRAKMIGFKYEDIDRNAAPARVESDTEMDMEDDEIAPELPSGFEGPVSHLDEVQEPAVVILGSDGPLTTPSIQIPRFSNGPTSEHPPSSASTKSMSEFTAKAKAYASPTIATKVAQAEVFAMWSQPLQAELQQGGWDEEDETISGKVYRPQGGGSSFEVFQDDEDEGTVAGLAVRPVPVPVFKAEDENVPPSLKSILKRRPEDGYVVSERASDARHSGDRAPSGMPTRRSLSAHSSPSLDRENGNPFVDDGPPVAGRKGLFAHLDSGSQSRYSDENDPRPLNVARDQSWPQSEAGSGSQMVHPSARHGISKGLHPSTPFQEMHRSQDYSDDENAELPDECMPMTTRPLGCSTINKRLANAKTFDYMTPITERSENERTMALSTISRAHSYDAHDRTLDRTCLTFGDRTLSSISGADMDSGTSLRSAEYEPEGLFAARPAFVRGSMVGIGRIGTEQEEPNRCTEGLNVIHPDVSGWRVADDDENADDEAGDDDGSIFGTDAEVVGAQNGRARYVQQAHLLRAGSPPPSAQLLRAVSPSPSVAPTTKPGESSLTELQSCIESWQPFRHVDHDNASVPSKGSATPSGANEHPSHTAAVELENSKEDASMPTESATKRMEPIRKTTITIAPRPIVEAKLCVPNPCNPYEPAVMNVLISRFDSSPYEYHFDCHEKFGGYGKLLDKASRTDRNGGRNRGLAQANRGDLQPTFIEFPEIGNYRLVKKLGEGGFAKVFLLQKKEPLSDEKVDFRNYDSDPDSDEENGGDKSGASDNKQDPRICVLKVQAPPTPWEFYMLHTLRSRLSKRIVDSIVEPLSCHLFSDESCLRMHFAKQGTLLDCVNIAAQQGYGGGIGSVAPAPGQGGVDEVLAAFWAIEVLRTIEAVHAAGMIHGDMKADNVLARLTDGEEGEVWDVLYKENGECGWANRGITIVDWGTAIDLRMFEDGQRFVVPPTQPATGRSRAGRGADPSVESWEVRNGVSWRYETDWYGAAGIIHVLLFGKYMEVIEGVDDAPAPDGTAAKGKPRPRVKPSGSFKRYWQVDLWREVFDVLLNSGARNQRLLAGAHPSNTDSPIDDVPVEEWMVGPGTDYRALEQEFPAIKDIRKVRAGLEKWLVGVSVRSSKNLKMLLKRVAQPPADEWARGRK